MNRPIQKDLKLAIFDFDGTLFHLNSYHVFLRYLMTRPRISSLKLLSAVVLRKANIVSRSALIHLALAYLKGKTRSEVEMLGQDIYRKHIFPQLNRTGLCEMENKRQAGYRIIVLSGAFDFMLKPFCETHQIDQWRSTQLAYQDNICSGALEGEQFLGEAKSIYLQHVFSNANVDWGSSCAYSDEACDLPLLSLVGDRYFVLTSGKHAPSLPIKIQAVKW